VFETRQLQKHALECQRLQAECMQTGGRCSRLQCAVAFRFHGTVLGHFSGFGTEFECRPGNFQSRDRGNMTDRLLSGRTDVMCELHPGAFVHRTTMQPAEALRLETVHRGNRRLDASAIRNVWPTEMFTYMRAEMAVLYALLAQ
jgi:hypothetical protein